MKCNQQINVKTQLNFVKIYNQYNMKIKLYHNLRLNNNKCSNINIYHHKIQLKTNLKLNYNYCNKIKKNLNPILQRIIINQQIQV